MLSKVIPQIFVGFLLRLIALLINSFWFTLPQGGADAKKFERLAYELATANASNGNFALEGGDRLMIYLGSIVYRIVGRSEFLLSLIMLLLGLMIIVTVSRIVLIITNNTKHAGRAAWLAALFPQLILHSVLFLREIPFALLAVLALLALVKYFKGLGLVHILKFFVFAAGATIFHSGGVSLLFGGILSLAWISSGNRLKIQALLVAATFAVIVLYLGQSGFGMQKFGGSLDSSISEFQTRELGETLGNAAFPGWMRITTGISDLWKLPIRIVAYQFSPAIPFMVRSPYHLLGLIDALFYILMIRRLYLKRKIDFKEFPVFHKSFLPTMIIGTLIFSLGVSNFGTAIRHRAKFAPILIAAVYVLPSKKNTI